MMGLQIWMNCIWSDETLRRLRLPQTDPQSVHINQLEFFIVILQLAAYMTAFATLPKEYLQHRLPRQIIPAEPIINIRTDNTSAESWANKVTARTLRAQPLVKAWAALLDRTHIGIQAHYIPGQENVIADTISRPTPLGLSHSEIVDQIVHQQSVLKKWHYFRPSHSLILALRSALYSGPAMELPTNPTSLGRIETDAYICSSSLRV